MAVAVPYQCLGICGNIIIAAQGSRIRSFNTKLELLASWRHPGKTAAEGAKETTGPNLEDGSPPAKRRRTSAADVSGVPEAQDEDRAQSADGVPALPPPTYGKKGKSKKQAKPSRQVESLDRPFVQNLRATPEGRHVVAVTGTDKTLWVFEHDGQGNLKLLSQRAMPKRPCALDFTPDRVTILVADKFGDVYALPLIPSGAPETPTPSARDCTPATPVPFRPQANELTVHSKRNLRALLDQRKAVLQPSEKPAAASFEHTLLLGHVSMLTGITHATDPHTGRPYIITADRDEHLRVSRGVLSQAHVIEGFCFGHDEFISRICIPPASPELLLSAGGDDEIYLWEWCAGRLITKANVLSHVQEIRPEANRVAVSFLCAHGSGSGGSEPSHHVFVFCERVPAVFIFELTPQRQLHHAQTVPLPMFPLEAVWVEADLDGLLLSVDTNPWSKTMGAEGIDDSSAFATQAAGSSLARPPFLLVKRRPEGCWALDELQPQLGVAGGPEESGDDQTKPEELQKLLYIAESLRKREGPGGEE